MTTPTTADVRAWARQNGMTVAERGRLNPEILDAYATAHGGSRPSTGGTGASTSAKKTAGRTVKKTARKAPAKKTAKRGPGRPSAKRSAPRSANPAVSPPPPEPTTPSLDAPLPSTLQAPVAPAFDEPEPLAAAPEPAQFSEPELSLDPEPLVTDAGSAADTGALESEVAALRDQVAALTARLERLESAPAAKPSRWRRRG